MTWTNRYREQEINDQAIINEHTPGKRIARAITEIQDKVVKEVDLITGRGLAGEASIEQNVLRINLELNSEPGQEDETSPGQGGGGASLPTDGQPGMYLRFSPDGDHFWDYVRAVEV